MARWLPYNWVAATSISSAERFYRGKLNRWRTRAGAKLLQRRQCLLRKSKIGVSGHIVTLLVPTTVNLLHPRFCSRAKAEL